MAGRGSRLLSHGATQDAAEQVLADIGTFEGEKTAKR
jgi:hypothetical protein